ncbi:MAG: hypothetical protein QM778_30560 [Myxococcales bacterium]
MYRKLFASFALASLSLACNSEAPRPPKPGEVCFGLQSAPNNDACEPQRCLQEKYELDVNDHAATLSCNLSGPTCDLPPNGTDTTYFDFFKDDYEVILGFDNRILDGYSLAAFKQYLKDAEIEFNVRTSAPLYATLAQGTTVEFLSYDAPILHVRVKGGATTTNLTTTSDPYPCITFQGPKFCTSQLCTYEATQEGGGPAQLIADLELAVQQPTP